MTDLPDNCTITILANCGHDRFHNDVKCTKNDGGCAICKQYAQLWKEDRKGEAMALKPVERHYFRCRIDGKEETVTFGRQLGEIIGDRTGEFNFLRTFVHVGGSKSILEGPGTHPEDRTYPNYAKSKFIEE